ncbi:MAG: T9SS type A sorting domain-containing protein [Bacteroidales bacterium]|nr:T9SS type A sorting domain-containing protein [Bacteroidales bacterium]
MEEIKKWLLLGCLLWTLNGVAQNHWIPNSHQFPMNMNVIAVLEVNGIEQSNEMLELGVFCGDECRGSCILQYFDEPLDRYMLFLTAYGAEGDPFLFRLYDHLTQQELDFVSGNTMTYHTNALIGDLMEPYVFSFIAGNCTVSVAADPDQLGEVTGGGSCLCGTYCTVSASPLGGSVFLGWTLNDDTLATASSYSFNAVADLLLTAHFASPEYSVTVSASPSEGGTVDGGGAYALGATCRVTAMPNEGYLFESWTEEGVVVSEEPDYSFEVQSDRELVAVFKVEDSPEYFEIAVEVLPAEGGSVVGAGFYEEGSECTLSVDLNENYLFVNWTENGVEVSADRIYSFVVTEPRSLVAHVLFYSELPDSSEKAVLYPNPSHGWVWLKDVAALHEEPFVVYDILGNQVLTTFDNPMNLSGLEAGVYYVKIQGGSARKLVLSR